MTAKTTHYQSFTPQSTNIGGYRYSFNGQEGDNEVYEIGGFQSYGFRMYDTRIARFWGVDPLAKDYPMLTPFQFASCSPILCIDVDGLEGIENTRVNMEDGVVHTYFNARQSTYVAPKWFTQPTLTLSDSHMVSWSSGTIGEIKVPRPISRFELWLETPAKNAFDFTFKSLSKFGYSYVNSPYSLLFGTTISGSSLNPSQRMDAFVDFVPGAMLGSLTFTGQITRAGLGLKGYNKYVKESKEMGTLPSQKDLPIGVSWQTETGKMYQVNKHNQQILDDANHFLKGINLSNSFIKNAPEQLQQTNQKP